MNRRGFFKTLLAGAVAAVMPKPKLPPFQFHGVGSKLHDQYLADMRGYRQHWYFNPDASPVLEIWPKPKIGDTIHVKAPLRFHRDAFALISDRAEVEIEEQRCQDELFLSGDKWDAPAISSRRRLADSSRLEESHSTGMRSSWRPSPASPRPVASAPAPVSSGTAGIGGVSTTPAAGAAPAASAATSAQDGISGPAT